MAAPTKDEKEKVAPIIIKRVKKGGGGHHGGAWKVAYADFVTAMMAFFLLLWLLNVTTKEQKNAISDYFDPSHPKVSATVSGAGGVLGGMTVSPSGAMVTSVQPLVQSQERNSDTRGELSGIKNPEGELTDATAERLEAELRAKEDKRFEEAAAQIKSEIAKTPELQELQKNILIDITPEGLRIQIVDDKGRSMFPSGSAVMYDFMRQILLKVAGVVVALPNQASVRGHTDSNKYKDPRNYDNWNLSADRAQASRRVLVSGGLPEARIENVMGRADREHLDKDPASARNRRISIILLRKAPTPEELKKLKDENAKTAAEQKALEGQRGVPVTIVDDTQPQTPAQKPAEGPAQPAQQTAPQAATGGTAQKPGAAADPNAPKAEYNQPQKPAPLTPLPTTPRPDQFQRQPQIMYFGEQAKPAPDGSAPLYDGPTVAPIRNKPPQIRTPLFELDPIPATPAAPAPAQNPAPPSAPAPAPSQKSLSFGDAVPAQAAPLTRAPLPAAPSLQLDNSKAGPAPEAAPAAPAPAPQTLEFGDSPAQSIVPNIVPPVPESAKTAPPASSVPENPPVKGKQLEF